MSSRKKNTAEEKNKTEYFSWSGDEVYPWIAVKDVNYS